MEKNKLPHLSKQKQIAAASAFELINHLCYTNEYGSEYLFINLIKRYYF